MKRALIILALCCSSHSLHAGVESIGGNASVTIPSGWVVERNPPIISTHSPDFAVTFTAFAEAVDRPGIWGLSPVFRDTVVGRIWDTLVLTSMRSFLAGGFDLLPVCGPLRVRRSGSISSIG